MDPNPVAALATTRLALREMKQDLVRTEGIGTDVPLTVMTLQGTQPIGSYEPSDTRQMAATIYTAVTLSDCDVVMACGEIYVDASGNGEDLHSRFAMGDPDVKECVAFTAFFRSGEVRHSYDPYRYDGRRVVWERYEGAPVRRPTLAEARKGIAAAFEHQANRPGPPLLRPGAQLIDLGRERVCEHLMVAHFALVSPCVCGSGRPMNECCNIRN